MQKMHRDEIQIRDPFFMKDSKNKCYYLVGSTDENIWTTGCSFKGYMTRDLETFEGPYTLFENSESFWAEKQFWAPEVHHYNGKYYMFASFYGDPFLRATQILSSDEPLGRYEPISNKPITPDGWECLDGTLYVEDGTPWVVFCHSWEQIEDGTICATPLSDDLMATISDPITLFSAKSSGWAHEYPEKGKYVTDGPYCYKTSDGHLILLWSSFMNGKYAIGQARSISGNVSGPYEHLELLYTDDGGHGMLFERFDGQLMLSIHTPNDTPNERIKLLPIADMGDRLVVIEG